MTDNDERDVELEEAEIRAAVVEAVQTVVTTELQHVASYRGMVAGNVIENAIYGAVKEAAIEVVQDFLKENPYVVADAITSAFKEAK